MSRFHRRRYRKITPRQGIPAGGLLCLLKNPIYVLLDPDVAPVISAFLAICYLQGGFLDTFWRYNENKEIQENPEAYSQKYIDGSEHG